MKIYPDGYSVDLQVGFTDLNDTAITPTSISAILYDGEDQVVNDFGTITVAVGDTSKSIIVSGEFNELADGELQAARVLRVELVTNAGSIHRSFSYGIEGEFRLALMQNSFISYEAAELLARNKANFNGWNNADETRRHAALIDAYSRLTRIPMRFNTLDAEKNQSFDGETIITRNMWSEVTATDFLAYPVHFRQAVRLAQLTETNELLQGESLARKHRSGIATETIGESSVTLRKGHIDYGVSSPTLAHLTGFIYFNTRVVRA